MYHVLAAKTCQRSVGKCAAIPSEAQSGNKHLEPNRDMGYILEQKRSSRQQQTSNAVNEKLPSPKPNRSLKFQDKSQVEGSFGQIYLDRRHESRQSAGVGLEFQLKNSGNHQNQSTGKKENKDDELIKHMSNLPGYLQREETGKNLQGKALSFGVLDWEHLENWKHQKQMLPRVKANSSSFGSNSSFTESGSSSLSRGKTFVPPEKQPPLGNSCPSSSGGAGLSREAKHSKGKAVQHQDLGLGPRSTTSGQRRVRFTNKSSGAIHSELKLERAMRKGSDQKSIPVRETASSYLRKHGFSFASKDTRRGKGGETKQRAESSSSESNIAYEHCPREQESIVLLLPKHSSKKSCPELIQLSEPKIILNGNLTVANRKSIPNSCPLPVKVETNIESDLKQTSLTGAPGMELPPDALHVCPCSKESPTILSKVKSIDENKEMEKSSTSNATEISQGLDQETAEPAAEKERHSSSNRRFSFSLGRMSRSFSFKEGSALPQLPPSYATARSGPLKSEASECLDNLKANKISAHSRARSSPLRRFLDPLLRPKVANPNRSAETVQPLKGNAKSSPSKPIDSNESSKDKKHGVSKVEALLQLTVKNGLPLFKLVVDNSSDILFATMRKLTTSGRDNSSWICTFYALHEIKKKSGGWIHQGHKEKSCSIGYNIVGQMMISSSHSPDMTSHSLKSQFALRECVLCSVDHRQSDQSTPEIVPSRELAAIVIKIPSDNSNDYGEQCKKGEDVIGNGFTETLQDKSNSWNIRENKNSSSSSTVVILPGGVHSLPDKGTPSPLINRWKSGGSCDCGGWDVGCRLRIITDQDQSCMESGPSVHFSTSDRLDLFVQGGAQENKPIFSLAPFKKGIYSVEFNTSISLLQAFSICIAFVSSQKSTDLSEVNIPSEDKFFEEPDLSGSDRMKTHTTVQREVLGKYVPSPPPSPVGRV